MKTTRMTKRQRAVMLMMRDGHTWAVAAAWNFWTSTATINCRNALMKKGWFVYSPMYGFRLSDQGHKVIFYE